MTALLTNGRSSSCLGQLVLELRTSLLSIELLMILRFIYRNPLKSCNSSELSKLQSSSSSSLNFDILFFYSPFIFEILNAILFLLLNALSNLVLQFLIISRTLALVRFSARHVSNPYLVLYSLESLLFSIICLYFNLYSLTKQLNWCMYILYFFSAAASKKSVHYSLNLTWIVLNASDVM